MRIVHLSTHDVLGGAARAAYRLHEGLRAAGEESSMLVNWKVSNFDQVEELNPEKQIDWHLGELVQRYKIDQNRSAITNTYFSLGWPGYDVSAHPLIQQAEIIHLHWVSCYQSPRTLAKLQALGKPMVWSLHDQRAFTGGCHYSAGCLKYEHDCANCPQLAEDDFALPAASLAEQLQLVRGREIRVVALSRWMGECARRSRVFRESSVTLIPNALNTEVFAPYERTEAREQLGLPAKAFCLLFSVDNGKESRKGFRELGQVLQHCLGQPGFAKSIQEGAISCVCFGHPEPDLKKLPVPVRSLGFIKSDQELAKVYSAANLFLVTSLEDNLPNTVMESMGCGTPVAAFTTGGVPDMVAEGLTGHLAPLGDTRKLAKVVAAACASPHPLTALGFNARVYVEENFSYRRQAARFQELYGELLASPRPAPARASEPTPSRPGTLFDQALGGILHRLLGRPEILDQALSVLSPRTLRPSPEADPEYGWRRKRLQNQVAKALKLTEAGDLTTEDLLLQLKTALAFYEGKLSMPRDRVLRKVLGEWLFRKLVQR